ncbi:hypothetical protein GCM10027082_29410 [Comamonas humi]
MLQTMPIARQAIMQADGGIVGYELFNRSRPGNGHTLDSDVALAFTVLSHVEPDVLVGKHLLFLNCTHETLAGEHLALLPIRQVVLEIPSLGHAAGHEVQTRLPVLQALRQRGFRLAFDHFVLDGAYAPWLPLADFIKIDLSVLTPDRAVLLMQYARRRSAATLVADKIETAAQLRLAREHHADLLQGFAVARPTVGSARILVPTLAQVRQLAARPAGPALAAYVERHAVPAYNLMRLMRSLHLDAAHQCLAIDEMLQTLGPQQLGRWANMMRSVTHARIPQGLLDRQAAVQARYTAEQSDADGQPIAFVVALAAALIHESQAISALHLPVLVQQALYEQAGPLAAYLQQARATEAWRTGPAGQALPPPHLARWQAAEQWANAA